MNYNSSFEQLIINAINKCNGMLVDDIAKPFQLLYPFTTENINGYINYFNLYCKKLLTVGSSGDQIINASLYDCKDIVCLDICPYTKFYFYLKLSCLLELDRDKFLTFLCYKYKTFKDNELSFHNSNYQKIKSTLRLLDYESYLFWDELFSNFRGLDIRKELFYFDENKMDVIIKSNSYLQSNIVYDEVRRKIMKTRIEFINDDILKSKKDRLFDVIWLSNIGTYLSRHFVKIMVDKVSKELNDDGMLLISYLYKTVKTTKYQQDWNPIYNLEKTFDILQEYSPKLISFIGVDGISFHDSTIKDSILVYTKGKNS
ncbi:MAG: hypothetical protein J6D28_05995 [Bacilli bacterium]|nr:hypothetical protein [Bacilli bacterium]